MNSFRKNISTLSLLLGLLFLSVAATAQDKDKSAESDTTEIAFKDRRIIIISDDEGKRVEIKDKDVIVIEDGDASEIIIEEEGYEEGYEEGEDEYDESFEYEYEDEFDPDYDHKEKKRKSAKRSKVGLLAFDLGIANYYNGSVYGVDAATPDLELNAFRPGAHVALHFLPTRASISRRGGVSLKTALTIDWSNYYFVNDIRLIDAEEQLLIENTNIDFTRNKLAARYAQIPLLLSFNSDPGGDDGLEVSVGVYGGILWKAWTKQVYFEDGQKKVDKVNGAYHLNPLRYGLMGRVDFKWFDLYVMYNLSDLFEEGQLPQTQTLIAGINIIDF